MGITFNIVQIVFWKLHPNDGFIIYECATQLNAKKYVANAFENVFRLLLNVFGACHLVEHLFIQTYHLSKMKQNTGEQFHETTMFDFVLCFDSLCMHGVSVRIMLGRGNFFFDDNFNKSKRLQMRFKSQNMGLKFIIVQCAWFCCVQPNTYMSEYQRNQTDFNWTTIIVDKMKYQVVKPIFMI